MNETTATRWVSPEEAATALRVTLRTVYTYIGTGKLKSSKPAGRRMILEEDLEAFMRGGEADR